VVCEGGGSTLADFLWQPHGIRSTNERIITNDELRIMDESIRIGYSTDYFVTVAG
jgi:hypothetical protein